MRQWLYVGAEEYVLERLSEGRMTLSRAAELLELSIYDIQQLAQEHGIEIGATAEQYARAKEAGRELGKKLNMTKQ
ncbi:MAG: hypothetical protein ACE5JP_18220 [Candidatus Bipolaricaulia bacterium]